jgi:hypothetical protein
MHHVFVCEPGDAFHKKEGDDRKNNYN